MIQVVEKLPGSAVAHAEVARRLGEGAAVLDVLEQRDLAGADGPLASEIDPETNCWSWHASLPCDIKATTLPDTRRLRASLVICDDMFSGI